VKAFKTGVRLPSIPKMYRVSAFLKWKTINNIMGWSWFRLGEIMETATGEVTVLNSAKLIDAKASKFEYMTVGFSLEAADMVA
jgi:hypothetical protein